MTDEQDIAAIEQVVADTERFQNDTEGFTRLLTENAALVNYAGRRVLGRSAIHAAMTKALETPLASVYTKNEIVDIRLLRPDVALVSCIKHISDERDPSARDAAAPLLEQTSLTFVMVKEVGTWLVASAQTTPIRS
ncbi:MAG TPA: SgcJ/EcaC family oxidoreductase [Jiangellaceae bacterium]